MQNSMFGHVFFLPVNNRYQSLAIGGIDATNLDVASVESQLQGMGGQGPVSYAILGPKGREFACVTLYLDVVFSDRQGLWVSHITRLPVPANHVLDAMQGFYGQSANRLREIVDVCLTRNPDINQVQHELQNLVSEIERKLIPATTAGKKTDDNSDTRSHTGSQKPIQAKAEYTDIEAALKLVIRHQQHIAQEMQRLKNVAILCAGVLSVLIFVEVAKLFFALVHKS